MSERNKLRLRDVAVGLAAALIRVRRHEGACLLVTPLGTVAFVDPMTCPCGSDDGAYYIGCHSWPATGFRRIGDIDVRAARR